MNEHETKRQKERRLVKEADALMAPTVPTSREIKTLVADALTAEELWGEATKKCFERYRAAGRALELMKASLEHGAWIPWLKGNCPRKYRETLDEHGGAWARMAQRWMRIAYILDHASAQALESAQSVSQLFRLAGFLQEGGGEPCGDETPLQLATPQILSRLDGWVKKTAPLLSPEAVRQWSAEDRADLREKLRPIEELLAVLQ